MLAEFLTIFFFGVIAGGLLCRRGPRGYAGAMGPPGMPGPAGANGADGKDWDHYDDNQYEDERQLTMNVRFVHPCDRTPVNPKLGDWWRPGEELLEFNGVQWVAYTILELKTPEHQYQVQWLDLLTDIAKKFEKTNTLLARIENAVQCCEETMQAVRKNTR